MVPLTCIETFPNFLHIMDRWYFNGNKIHHNTSVFNRQLLMGLKQIPKFSKVRFTFIQHDQTFKKEKCGFVKQIPGWKDMLAL